MKDIVDDVSLSLFRVALLPDVYEYNQEPAGLLRLGVLPPLVSLVSKVFMYIIL